MTSNLFRIDYDAIVENYKIVKKNLSKHCSAGVMLKNNAYQCGAEKVLELLYQEGARHFFVSTVKEALELVKKSKKEANIYVLHDLTEDNYELFLKHDLIPVLTTMNKIKLWFAMGKNKPCVLQYDSGLNRLGLLDEDLDYLSEKKILNELNIAFVMTHCASSNDKRSKLTEKQYKAFMNIKKYFPKNMKYSFCKSDGAFLDKKYHQDISRIGACLYGVKPADLDKNPMKPVVYVNAKVLQVKKVKKGGTVGYNETFKFKQDGRIAVIEVGYSDHLMRAHTNSLNVFFKGNVLPVIGRISMNLTTIDISSLKEGEMQEDDMVEVINEKQGVDEVGEFANTSGYEILLYSANKV